MMRSKKKLYFFGFMIFFYIFASCFRFMEKVECVNCGHIVTIDIAKAIDENGEVFKCPNCGLTFRYTAK